MRSQPEHAGPKPTHAMCPDRRKHRSLGYPPSRENRPFLSLMSEALTLRSAAELMAASYRQAKIVRPAGRGARRHHDRTGRRRSSRLRRRPHPCACSCGDRARRCGLSCTSARFADSRVVQQREDALFLGLGTGKNHLAQAIDRAAIQQGYRVAAISAHSPLRCRPLLLGDADDLPSAPIASQRLHPSDTRYGFATLDMDLRLSSATFFLTGNTKGPRIPPNLNARARGSGPAFFQAGSQRRL